MAHLYLPAETSPELFDDFDPGLTPECIAAAGVTAIAFGKAMYWVADFMPVGERAVELVGQGYKIVGLAIAAGAGVLKLSQVAHDRHLSQT